MSDDFNKLILQSLEATRQANVYLAMIADSLKTKATTETKATRPKHVEGKIPTKAEFKKLINHMTFRQIADKYGVTLRTVCNWRKLHNVRAKGAAWWHQKRKAEAV